MNNANWSCIIGLLAMAFPCHSFGDDNCVDVLGNVYEHYDSSLAIHSESMARRASCGVSASSGQSSASFKLKALIKGVPIEGDSSGTRSQSEFSSLCRESYSANAKFLGSEQEILSINTKVIEAWQECMASERAGHRVWVQFNQANPLLFTIKQRWNKRYLFDPAELTHKSIKTSPASAITCDPDLSQTKVIPGGESGLTHACSRNIVDSFYLTIQTSANEKVLEIPPAPKKRVETQDIRVNFDRCPVSADTTFTRTYVPDGWKIDYSQSSIELNRPIGRDSLTVDPSSNQHSAKLVVFCNGNPDFSPIFNAHIYREEELTP